MSFIPYFEFTGQAREALTFYAKVSAARRNS